MSTDRTTEGALLDSDEQLFDRGAGIHAKGSDEPRQWFEAAQRELGLALGFEVFAARVEQAAPKPAHATDLFLATACSVRTPGAAELLLRRYGSGIATALGRMKLTPTQRDDAFSKALEVVFVGEGSGGAIDGYQGRGSLEGWLKVAAVRAAHRVLRQRSTVELRDTDATPDPTEVSAAAGMWLEQERALLDTEGTTVFRDALRAALARRTAEERRALRLHYADRLSIDVLAELWNVHRATAARRIAKLREQIRDDVLETLQTRFATSPSSVGRWVRHMQSQLSGLSSLLR